MKTVCPPLSRAVLTGILVIITPTGDHTYLVISTSFFLLTVIQTVTVEADVAGINKNNDKNTVIL